MNEKRAGPRARGSIAAFLALGFAVACGAKTEAVLLNPTAQRCPAISPDSVRMFATQAELESLNVPYVTIATLRTSYTGWDPNGHPEKIIASEREKAAAIGANGIVLPRFRGASVIAVHYGPQCVNQS